jgi:uroporphyrinogen decarboxylase
MAFPRNAEEVLSLMTGREIARMALELKTPPRLPVTLIGGGSWIVNSAGKTFAEIKGAPEKIAEVFIKAYELVGHDLLWIGSGLVNYPFQPLGCPLNDDSSDTPALLGTAIKSLDEVDSLDLKKVIEDPTVRRIIRSHHLVADSIGKKTFLMPTLWGPLTSASRLLGVETVMMATLEDPDRLQKLIRFSAELIWSLLAPILEHPDILGANFSDPVSSGDMISPRTFRKFSAPFLKELVRRVREKGKYAMIHICGNASGILPDIVDISPHAFSLEKKVDLRLAKEALGGKVCVVGNVSPTGAFLSGRPEEVAAEARGCLEAWGGGGGFILTVGCDFPKTVPLENIRALMSMKNPQRP